MTISTETRGFTVRQARNQDLDQARDVIRLVLDRRGIARALVDAARRYVAAGGGYDVIYLHTNPDTPGAEAFWRSMPMTEIYDGRSDDGPSRALHFELAFPKRTSADESFSQCRA